ncbi:MAG TPA: ferric reductase-like transmembrane domain-containing protein [Desulforhopalus sp.]|nr:ferric reductase-like transmembrane domain-containing protein [Desulforhopalus sp.]
MQAPVKPGRTFFGQRQLYLRILLAALFLLLAGAAVSVVFVYETQTLWYKVGWKKTMLQVGQMSGLLALLCLQVQILLGARVALLAEIFGAAALMRLHRTNGLLIVALALSHAALVVIPEGVTNLPLGWKFWPEQLGVILLFFLLATVITAWFREQLAFSYPRWRAFHRLIGYPAVAVAALHVLFVSESFAGGLPRTVLLCFTAGVLLWVVSDRLLTRTLAQKA